MYCIYILEEVFEVFILMYGCLFVLLFVIIVLSFSGVYM